MRNLEKDGPEETGDKNYKLKIPPRYKNKKVIDSLIKRTIEEDYLYEGLIYSRDIDLMLSHLNQWNSGINVAFFKFGGKSNSENRMGMLLTTKLEENELENIFKKVNNYGWFPSYFYSKDQLSDKYKFEINSFKQFYKTHEKSVIVFDAKFDMELLNANGIDNLYHITPKRFKEKILKIGLAPKSKNKTATHPNRVYLCKTYEDVIALMDHNKFYPNDRIFVVFQINNKELIKRRDIKYFVDPAYIDAIYTYENIPPQYIKLYNEVERHF